MHTVLRILTVLMIIALTGCIRNTNDVDTVRQEMQTVDEAPEMIPSPTQAATSPLLSCPPELPAHYAQDKRSRGTLVVVYKSLYRVGVYEDGALKVDGSTSMCYPIAMGAKPWGAKVVVDNQSTPEGWYKATTKQDVGSTAFYRGFMINYPNQQDVTRAYETGVIEEDLYRSMTASIKAGHTPPQDTVMGGEIMIHGMGAWTPVWTAGCVATDNAVMDILFRHVRRGDDVLITPWTERYASSLISGELVVSNVPLPKGQVAEMTLPFQPAWLGGSVQAEFVNLRIDLEVPSVTLTIP